jgi:hypothetical protein
MLPETYEIAAFWSLKVRALGRESRNEACPRLLLCRFGRQTGAGACGPAPDSSRCFVKTFTFDRSENSPLVPTSLG